MISRQRKWQILQQQNGNCITCGKIRTGISISYCETHREQQKKYYKVIKVFCDKCEKEIETGKKAFRQFYSSRIKLDLCPKCDAALEKHIKGFNLKERNR